MGTTQTTFKKVLSLRERYYRSSIGKESLLDLISEAKIAEPVYNSNAIENSTLTLEETEKNPSPDRPRSIHHRTGDF